jgi:hypothetical protein
MSSALDDRTVAYVIAAQPLFDDLRQVAAQLAGLLVLAATGSKEASPHHPMLASAKQLYAKADDGVKRAGSLVHERAREHYCDLLAASEALTRALAFLERWPTDIDAVLVPLRDAYGHLQAASRALPGFQMVSFEQACCGVHQSSL